MSVRTISTWWDGLGAAVAILSVGIAYWLMADLALALSRPTGVAALWPAAGVATGALMVAGPAARPWIAAVVVVTSFHVSLAIGHTWPAAAVFGACNALEAVAVAAACCGSGQGQDVLARPAAAFVFVACAALAALGALGVRIALDDFGRGHSNLSCLRRLPVDVIKVDHSFARGMVDNPSDALIVEAIVGLAKGLRKQVTVEGIETAAQLDAIRALGVNTAQGFLFSRPVPGHQVPELIVLHEGPRTTIIDLPRGTS